MPRPRHLLSLVLLVSLAGTAWAAGRIVGPGYSMRPPPAFQRAPSSQAKDLQERFRALVKKTALPLVGDPERFVYVGFSGDNAGELFLVHSWKLPVGRDGAAASEIRHGLEMALQGVDVALQDEDQRVTSVPLVSGRLAFRFHLRPLGTEGEATWPVTALVAAGGGRLLVIVLRSPTAHLATPATWWGPVLASMRLQNHIAHASTAPWEKGALILALVGLLMALGASFWLRRSKAVGAAGVPGVTLPPPLPQPAPSAARQAPRPSPAHTPPVPEVASTPAEGPSLSRALDGLDHVMQERAVDEAQAASAPVEPTEAAPPRSDAPVPAPADPVPAAALPQPDAAPAPTPAPCPTPRVLSPTPAERQWCTPEDEVDLAEDLSETASMDLEDLLAGGGFAVVKDRPPTGANEAAAPPPPSRPTLKIQHLPRPDTTGASETPAAPSGLKIQRNEDYLG